MQPTRDSAAVMLLLQGAETEALGAAALERVERLRYTREECRSVLGAVPERGVETRPGGAGPESNRERECFCDCSGRDSGPTRVRRPPQGEENFCSGGRPGVGWECPQANSLGVA